jgi:RND family efflux transporter MFP subunit
MTKTPRSRRSFLTGSLLIAASGLLALLLWWSAPEPAAPAPDAPPPTVEYVVARPGDVRATIRGYGTVRAREQVLLGAQVPGTIAHVEPSLEVGARVRRGQLLFQLEPADYAAAAAIAEAEACEAELRLREARGRKDVAAGEWRLLPAEVQEQAPDRDLVQHVPQLRAAEARHRAAQATREKALQDLARTDLRAPFDGVVLEEHVAPGQSVTVGEGLITLASTETYAVEISVPAGMAAWIDITPGAAVPLHWGPADHARATGRVAALIGDVTSQDRQARVLVLIPDPGAYTSLLIGTHVEAELPTREFADAVKLPSQSLRGGDAIWLLDAENRLEVRSVEPLLAQAGSTVLRNALASGERVIVSNLAAPLAGMRLAGTEKP